MGNASLIYSVFIVSVAAILQVSQGSIVLLRDFVSPKAASIWLDFGIGILAVVGSILNYIDFANLTESGDFFDIIIDFKNVTQDSKIEILFTSILFIRNGFPELG